MELMVVVILVAVLAVIASPSFSEARNDRIAFDYSRQFSQILVQGRARAAGTGAAHLMLLAPGKGGRGFIRLYEAMNGVTDPGPGPVSSCRQNPNQWDEAQADDPPNLTGNNARFIDFSDINRGGVNETMNLRADLFYGDASDNAMGAVKVLAICISPSGITYVGSGAAVPDAIAAMRSSSPFNGVAEVRIQRHLPGNSGDGIGLLRHIVITGGAAPRVRSE
jgi:type II secretory pathway pseudopilin PulG